MAVEVAAPKGTGVMGVVRQFPTWYREIVAEMRKVTWPDKTQVRQLSIGVVGLSLFIGAVIWLLDLGLQGLLVRLIPSLFGA